MKVDIKIWIVIAGLMLQYACDIDRIPEADLSDTNFWQNENDFQKGTNYLYTLFLPNSTSAEYPLYADQLSDNAMGLEPNDISNGTYLPDGNFGPWNSDYELIRAANKILEEAAMTDLGDGLTQFLAEARFFRAYGYQDLVRRYGDVPLIRKTLDIEDPELYTPRTPRGEVIDFIYADLDFAAANLGSKGDTDYGRITKGAALALKSRVGLREGTWLKYHNVSGSSNGPEFHLNIAKNAALQLMQSGEYALFDDYEELFKNAGEGPKNKEVIVVFRHEVDNDNRITNSNYTQQITRGFYSPTRSLVDSYLAVDGLPIEQSPLYQGQTDANSEFIDRDSRLLSIITEKGEEYVADAGSTEPAPQPYSPSIFTSTGYLVEKYVDVNGAYLDHIIMRYAEVLLNYAEAVYELNDAITDQELNLSINLLRNRAGMPNLTNGFVAANNLDMLNEIRRERRVELALEGFRYDDLLRWKTAETELPKALLGVKFFADDYSTDPSGLNLTDEGFLIGEPQSARFFDASKQYLWPIPLDQLALNPAMQQNPNW